MEFKNDTKITVLNYSDKVFLSGKNEEYSIDACYGDIPAECEVLFSDLKRLNGLSAVFKVKRLVFNPDEEKEIYEALSLKNMDEILSEKQIEEMILNPTDEDVERIINIKDQAYIDRIVRMLVGLQNTGQYDISTRFNDIIMRRDLELKSGVRISKISAKLPANVVNKETEDRVAKLEAMIAQLLAEKEQASKEVKEPKKTPSKPSTKSTQASK